MPYPTPTNPHYCPGSETRPDDYDAALQWQRCHHCQRPIVAKPNGTLFPHLDHPTRRRDAVQENLIAHGYNQRERWGVGGLIYAEPEP